MKKALAIKILPVLHEKNTGITCPVALALQIKFSLHLFCQKRQQKRLSFLNILAFVADKP